MQVSHLTCIRIKCVYKMWIWFYEHISMHTKAQEKAHTQSSDSFGSAPV